MTTRAVVRGGYREAMGTGASETERDPTRLSIVTVVRNGASTLEACIRSVALQEYGNVEHVIVDGGSTDGTVDILRRYDAQIACWVSEPDAGIYCALNKAISLCTGSRYVPLGCDDVLLPTAAGSFMRNAQLAPIVLGWVQFEPVSGSLTRIRNHSAGAMIHVDAHTVLGFYDETYRIAADTKFLSAARIQGMVAEIEDTVGIFVKGGASGNYAKNVREHARAMRESGAWGPLRCFTWRAPRLLLAAMRSRPTQ